MTLIYLYISLVSSTPVIIDFFASRVVRLKSSLDDFDEYRHYTRNNCSVINSANGLANLVLGMVSEFNMPTDSFLTVCVYAQELSQFAAESTNVLAYLEGALLSGFLAIDPVKLELEDPRGSNPPFGKTKSLDMEAGEVVLHWAAQPVGIPPASQSRRVLRLMVGYFQLSKAGRRKVIDWELDPMA